MRSRRNISSSWSPHPCNVLELVVLEDVVVELVVLVLEVVVVELVVVEPKIEVMV